MGIKIIHIYIEPLYLISRAQFNVIAVGTWYLLKQHLLKWNSVSVNKAKIGLNERKSIILSMVKLLPYIPLFFHFGF